MKTAERVGRACREAAIAEYEDAGIRGLGVEGRREKAASVMPVLDLEQLALLSYVSEAGAAAPGHGRNDDRSRS